jgi:hypothetical protein
MDLQKTLETMILESICTSSSRSTTASGCCTTAHTRGDGERGVQAGAQGLHGAVPARAARRRRPRAAARGRDLVPSQSSPAS